MFSNILIFILRAHILWNEDREIYIWLLESSIVPRTTSLRIPSTAFTSVFCSYKLTCFLKLFSWRASNLKAWLNIAIILYGIYFIARIWSDVLTDDFFSSFCSVSSQWTSQRVSLCIGPLIIKFHSKLQMHPSGSCLVL